MRHRVAQHLATHLIGPLGDIHRAARLDLLGHRQQLRSGHVGDGLGADGREYIRLQAPDHVVGMARAAVVLPLRPPGTGHAFKGGRGFQVCRELAIFALLCRIGAFLERGACGVAGDARLLQRDARIDTQREPPLLAVEAVFPKPIAAPIGAHFEVQALRIGVALVRFAFGTGSLLASRVGQGHMGEPRNNGGFRRKVHPEVPPLRRLHAAVNEPAQTTKPRLAGLCGVFDGLFRTLANF